MNKEIATLITQIARIRNVDTTYVTETLKQSIIAGLKRRYGPDIKPEVEVEPEQGDMRIYLLKTVAKEVKNDGSEISEYEAGKLKPDAKLGEELRVEIPTAEVGRIAIRKTSEELVLKLREAERTKLYDEYVTKRGEIVTGTIQKIGRDEIIVNLGLVEASLPMQEQLKTDHYRQGAPLKALVFRVDKTPFGPRILLSRTHPDFLRRLLHKEIPEIRQNVVEIKAIARAPSFRSKVAVFSVDERIDPVGACVGYRKSRIENVIKELSGEKIDIVQWSKDMQVYITRALGPARVKQVIPEGDTYVVVVPDDEFSIAIGKKGQNVWLAGLLVAAKLEVLKASDFDNRAIMNKATQVKLAELKLDRDIVTKLQDAQVLTLFDIMSIAADQLAEATELPVEQIEELKKKAGEYLRMSDQAAAEAETVEEESETAESETAEAEPEEREPVEEAPQSEPEPEPKAEPEAEEAPKEE
jgi:N utilization substance protein A